MCSQCILDMHQELQQVPDSKSIEDKEGPLSFRRDLERLMPLSSASGLRAVGWLHTPSQICLTRVPPLQFSVWPAQLITPHSLGTKCGILHSEAVIAVVRMTLGHLCKCRTLQTGRAAAFMLHHIMPLPEVPRPALHADTHTSTLLQVHMHLRKAVAVPEAPLEGHTPAADAPLLQAAASMAV